MTTLDSVNSFIDDVWEREVMPTMLEYIRIPNVSAVFEANWEELGHMERAVQLLGDWASQRPIEGSVPGEAMPSRAGRGAGLRGRSSTESAAAAVACALAAAAMLAPRARSSRSMDPKSGTSRCIG